MEHRTKKSEGLNAVSSLLNSRRVTVSQLAAGGSSSEQDIQNKLIEISIDREQQRQITKLIKQKLDKSEQAKRIIDLGVSLEDLHVEARSLASKNSDNKLSTKKSKLEIRKEEENLRLSELTDIERFEEFKDLYLNAIPTFKLK